ncbi:MAG: hypothetical protein ACRES7_08670 [Gammaproteobacteria bacterium]
MSAEKPTSSRASSAASRTSSAAVESRASGAARHPREGVCDRSCDEYNPDLIRSAGDEFDEIPDNVSNGIAQTLKRLNYGSIFENFNIAKEYINGRVGILVEFDRHTVIPPLLAAARSRV